MQFKFICIALFMTQIVAKQFYRKLKILQYISNSLSCQVDVHMAEMYSANNNNNKSDH